MPTPSFARRLAPRLVGGLALALLPIACASPAVPDVAPVSPPCARDAECPPSDVPCLVAVCRAGHCSTSPDAPGVDLAVQVDGDCQRAACDGQGHVVHREDLMDRPPSDELICTAELCEGDRPVHRPLPAGSGCGDGKVCNGASTCGACVPGQKRCGSGVIDACSAEGAWATESACTGSCWNGECAPFVEIALGSAHTCGRFADGSVACWGDDSHQQLGHSHDPPKGLDPALPKPIPSLRDVTDVEVGNEHACALRGDGTVACWGSNSFGQLGDGTRVDRTTPVAPLGIKARVKQIAAGDFHTCALLDDDRVRCWGENDDGQLGDGSVDRPIEGSGMGMLGMFVPEGGHRVHALDAVTMIRSRAELTCALERRGTVACWGSAVGYGSLIEGAAKMGKARPVEVRNLRGVTALALGASHSCALLGDGTARCWGNNDAGQLGDGTTRSRTSPAPVKGLVGIEALSAGSSFTCARLTDGGVQCWGTNGTGQLGDGTMEQRPTPVAVAGLRDAKGVVVSGSRACAVQASGSFMCWGAASYAEAGPTHRPTPGPLSIGAIVP